MTSLAHLSQSVIRCRKCSRLVRWREQVSKSPPQRYQGENYWAKPLPGFGDPQARVLSLGWRRRRMAIIAPAECLPAIAAAISSTELCTQPASLINPNRSIETMD